MPREYEAGEVQGLGEVPDIIQQVRDDLNKVRDGLGKLDEKEYGHFRGRTYVRPDPLEALRAQEARNALHKEEDRLMAELEGMLWLVPPAMEPPHNKVTQEKAKEILRHGEVHGEPLTKRQKGYFGVIAGGQKPRIDNPHPHKKRS